VGPYKYLSYAASLQATLAFRMAGGRYNFGSEREPRERKGGFSAS
jgi:hypothetical protein